MPACFPQLRDFDARQAARVAGWVRTDHELAWLSPDTPPPMTTARVLEWGGPGRRQFLIHTHDQPDPIGYAELNDMPTGFGDLWLGHMLLDPDHRGRGFGADCVRSVIVRAFDELSAQQIILVVVPDNRAAIGAYQRAGFLHRGEEWKTIPQTGATYRLLRMIIDRERYYALCAAGEMPSDLF